MGITVGTAKVKLEFDTAQAKAQLEQVKAGLERDKAKAAQLAKVNPNSFEFKHLKNSLLSKELKDKLTKRSLNRYELRQQQAAEVGGYNPAFILGAIRHPLRTAEQAALSPIGQTVGMTAATYGIARAATTATYLTMEAFKAALPEALKDNPLFSAIQEQIENVSKAMDNFESRIISFFKATGQTKDLAFAAARLSGRMPELGQYWDRAQQMAVQERDLNMAFERFKYKDIASGLGRKIRELTSESMNELFSNSIAK